MAMPPFLLGGAGKYRVNGYLLLVYAMTTGGFFMTLKTFLCSQGMNFACPLNSVDGETRDQFLKQNQVVFKAWQDHTTH